MQNSHPHTRFRKEVLKFQKACEEFLSFAGELNFNNASFSQDEQDVIEYYTREVQKKTLVTSDISK